MGQHCFVALGGNLGNVLDTFHSALAAMPRHGVHWVDVSSAFRTAALLPAGDANPAPDYWNAVCEIETSLTPEALLSVVLGIEARAGRVRDRRWAPRTLDLDILTYSDWVVDLPELTVPHPELSKRPFVLQPLVELAPDLTIPALGATVAELLREHPDPMAGIREVREGWFRGRRDSCRGAFVSASHQLSRRAPVSKRGRPVSRDNP